MSVVDQIIKEHCDSNHSSSYYLDPEAKLGRIGSAEFTTIPNNSHVAVSHSVEIDPNYRGQGHGQKFMKQRLEEMLEAKVLYVLCTVNENNGKQIKILEKFRWKKIAKIPGDCNGDVFLYGRHTYDYEEQT